MQLSLARAQGNRNTGARYGGGGRGFWRWEDAFLRNGILSPSATDIRSLYTTEHPVTLHNHTLETSRFETGYFQLPTQVSMRQSKKDALVTSHNTVKYRLYSHLTDIQVINCKHTKVPVTAVSVIHGEWPVLPSMISMMSQIFRVTEPTLASDDVT